MTDAELIARAKQVAEAAAILDSAPDARKEAWREGIEAGIVKLRIYAPHQDDTGSDLEIGYAAGYQTAINCLHAMIDGVKRMTDPDASPEAGGDLMLAVEQGVHHHEVPRICATPRALSARVAELEAENERLREYYDAVEAFDASGYSAAAIERIKRARAELRDMEGGKP